MIAGDKHPLAFLFQLHQNGNLSVNGRFYFFKRRFLPAVKLVEFITGEDA